MKNSDRWTWLSAEELRGNKQWWDIYEASFPSNERDPTIDLLNAAEKQLAIVGAYFIQEKLAAILVCYKIGTPSFIFLNFIAVAQSMRNHGLGFKIFTSFLEQIKAGITPFSSQYFAAVWEVEDPDKAKTPDDKILRDRRIKFYDKAGGKFLENLFIQPAIDGLNSVPMRLMYYIFNPEHLIHTLEKEIIHAIYFEKYQKINNIRTDVIEGLCKKIFAP